MAGLEVQAVVDLIRPLLAHRHPAVQSAVIADLFAIWLAGHPAELRAELRVEALALVDRLVPVNEAMIRGGDLSSDDGEAGHG